MALPVFSGLGWVAGVSSLSPDRHKPLSEHRSRREELASSVSHGLGAVASLAAGTLLTVFAAGRGDPWLIVGTAVFGITLVTLYTASTLYHAVPDPRVKARLKVFDHCAIFGLIAGTYTPFALGGVRGTWGWTLFGVIWGLAAAGIVLKLFLTGRFRMLSTAVYLGMGWLVVLAARPVVAALPVGVLVLLAAGGVAYTAGTWFYHNRRVRFAHAIWHLFVLAGSAFHAVAVGALVMTVA